MWPLAVLIILAPVAGLKMLQAEVFTPTVEISASKPALAKNIVTYKNVVDQFVAAQASGYSGAGPGNSVPDSSLTFPSWYVRNPLWSNKVISGTVTVYATSLPTAGDFSREVADITNGRRSVGIVGSATTTIISPLYGDTGIALPSGLPSGVTVMQNKVN